MSDSDILDWLATAPELSAVVARFNVAIRKQKWAEMRACCCDDAIIDSVTAGDARGPDETVAAVRAAYRDGVYQVSEWTHESIDGGAVISRGGVQYRPSPGRMRDAEFFWLTTGKEGLIWRVKAFDERHVALEHLEQFGPSLGL